MSYFFLSEYKITMIDSIKDYAIMDAYLKMYELLYRCEKVPAFIFRQKEQLPVAAEQLPVVTTNCTATNVIF